MIIREYVDVSPHPTVVRLDHLQSRDASWISETYYLGAETSRHFETLRQLLTRDSGCGVFLIGHYGSGKSHFLAYLTQQLRSSGSAQTAVVPISLLNYKSELSLESIVEKELGVAEGRQDRREVWNQVACRYPDGLLLVIDELSEYLRSKPSPQSFNEDLRFLQFLGEWAEGRRFWIVAALQEQIEHTGEIEYDLFRKIKDRYPYRLLLTPAHVRDLIACRILQKRATYAAAVEDLAGQLRAIYPHASIDFSELCEIYPLHPVTLELLEEVRDRFSQARGIVEFTLTQMLGSPERGITPFLDRPWGHLLTPDVIVDHFADLFEIQQEFLPIAQKMLPYFRRRVPELFQNKAQQELAWRVLKLLILVYLSPRRDSMQPEHAAEWLLFKVSTVDPGKNTEIIRKILEVLSSQGAYVKQDGSIYSLDLEDNSSEYLERLLANTIGEMRERGDLVFESLLPLLDAADFNPFSMPRGRWHGRKVRWHFHDWDLQVYFGGGVSPEPAPSSPALQIGLPWGAAAAAVCARIQPRAIEATPEILELAALRQLQDRPLPARVLSRVEERIASRAAWFRSLVRSAYLEASIVTANGPTAAAPLQPLNNSTSDWLHYYGEWLLRQTYPLFERFAPVSGPLPKEAYRQFMKFASEKDLGAADAPEFVKLIREAYLVPMALMQRKGPDYVLTPKLENNELVRLMTPILKHHPSPARVAEHLGAPVYGLVVDQVQLLLLVLLIEGELDIVKGERSYRETYETLPLPLLYDRVLPGHALNVEQLHRLQTLCEGFRISVPKHWSVLAQKRAVEQLRRFGRAQRDALSSFVSELNQTGEAGDVVSQLEALIAKWVALEKGEHELQAFQHFEFAIGSAARFVTEANELAALPQRFERLLRETQRLRHVLSDPAIGACSDSSIASRLEAIRQPPPLSQPEQVEGWLVAARDFYRSYQQWYRNRHEQWRSDVSPHPIWSYRPPRVAESRHVMALELAAELEALIARARGQRCAGLSGLDFQAICRCGFDGESGPLDKTLKDFERCRQALEDKLTLFFQQNEVKTRVREWIAQGIEVTTPALSYLEDKAGYPDVDNLRLFDQHLSGVDLVRSANLTDLADLLSGQTWDKASFMRALEQFFDRSGPRIAFSRPEAAPLRAELVQWCYERALTAGHRLPPVFSSAEQSEAARLIDPRWVREPALAVLSGLQLGEPVVHRVLRMILDGDVPVTETASLDSAVGAALQLLRPASPATAEELRINVERAYSQHERLMKLEPRRWLALLDGLANTALTVMPESLEGRLAAAVDAQWLVVDCLGLPLADTVRRTCATCMPSRRVLSMDYALVGETTSTAAFYDTLIEGRFKKEFVKLNAIDDLIHNRSLSLRELTRLASAELEIALRRVAGRFDPAKPILVFGDHGFRMSPDGRGFVHGGISTLERLTVAMLLG